MQDAIDLFTMPLPPSEKFIAVNRRQVDREEWDAFVDASDEAWLWHRFDLQDTIATWHGKCDHSFAVLDRSANDQIVAVVPLHTLLQRYIGRLPLHSLDSLGGIACANTMGNKERRKLLNYVVQKLRIMAWQHTANEIHFALTAMAPAFRGERCPRVNPLLELGCSNTLTQTWVVDLRTNTEGLWQRMEGRARTAIRKAQKMGVQVRCANQPGDLDSYYRLHCETYQRTGVRPHPKQYFAAIWERFLARDMAHIWFAEYAGQVVAAENFGIDKQAGIYWTGATSEQGLITEASSLLQWTAMQWMHDHDIKWYETGEAFPHVSEGKLKGLNDFKRSFGGTLYPIYRGKLVMSSRLQQLFTAYRALRGHLPS